MARLDTRCHSAGQSRVPCGESIPGGRARAVSLQPAGAALHHGVPSATLRFLFIQSRMGLFLVLERQDIRPSGLDVSVAPGTNRQQRSGLVWLVVAVSFELHPMVVLLPTHAPGNALVVGAGNRVCIVSDSAPDSAAAHRGECHPADYLDKFRLVPLPAVPDSAGLSRVGTGFHIRGGTPESNVDSRESDRSSM